MTTDNVTVSVGDKIPSLGLFTLFEDPKFDALGEFLNAHPDFDTLTEAQAKKAKRLCKQHSIGFEPFCAVAGELGKSYVPAATLLSRYPSLSEIVMPKGRAKLLFTKEVATHLKVRVLPQRVVAAPVTPKAPARPATSPKGTLTVIINGEKISMELAICGKPDVEKVTSLLTALTL